MNFVSRPARRAATVLVAAALLPGLLVGCDPSTAKHRAPERAAPTHAPQIQPNPEANQPGPQNDPGACNERGPREMELQAHWVSETDRTPSVNWTQNGVSTPATNLRSGHDGAGKSYSGEWSLSVRVKCGDIMSVNVKGNPSMITVFCVIVDLGQSKVTTGKRDCAVTYRVP